MPELPEVETSVQAIQEFANQKIETVRKSVYIHVTKTKNDLFSAMYFRVQFLFQRVRNEQVQNSSNIHQPHGILFQRLRCG